MRTKPKITEAVLLAAAVEQRAIVTMLAALTSMLQAVASEQAEERQYQPSGQLSRLERAVIRVLQALTRRQVVLLHYFILNSRLLDEVDNSEA
ncbi:hypothetical protein NSS64_05885 [Paenibacillus sp. FSL H8-0122]|uniref:hypothetical protein n=1 Tax=Paenibacillus sp. FSL H8-0122 TaxID=2954510 RepID=UPI0030FBE6A0